jgi:hypothetical protein
VFRKQVTRDTSAKPILDGDIGIQAKAGPAIFFYGYLEIVKITERCSRHLHVPETQTAAGFKSFIPKDLSGLTIMRYLSYSQRDRAYGPYT